LIGPSGDLLLGVDRNHRFHPARLQLAPGDVVLLYTDGLVERRREHLDTGLARLVSAAGGGGDLATIVADTVRLAPNNPREDDLCLLGIRITSGG
jgi:serine phosphatase RsbU (regulator of sigma subunit)